MTDGSDFCGERLRLTALLRTAEKMPRRPARFRRRWAEAEQNQATKNSPLTMDVPIDYTISTACTKSRLGLTSEPTEESVLDDLPRDASASGSHLPPSERGSSGTVIAPRISNPDRASANMRDAPKGRPLALLHVPTPRGKMRCAKATKQKKPNGFSRGPSNARKEKRFPVKELALVRTSTENGLPSPGVRSSSPRRFASSCA